MVVVQVGKAPAGGECVARNLQPEETTEGNARFSRIMRGSGKRNHLP